MVFEREDPPKVAGAAQRSAGGCQPVPTPNSLPGSGPGCRGVSTKLPCHTPSSPAASPRDEAGLLPWFTPRLSAAHREFPE